MIRTDKRLRLCTVLLVLNLAFIWGNSLMSGEVSRTFSEWVQSILFGTQPSNGVPVEGNTLLRKVAHFTEFAALGMCLGWLFGMLQKGKSIPLVCGIAAACMDETIQMFVPERAPGFTDVLIDSCGVLTGIALLYLGYTLIRKKRSANTTLEDK